MFADHWVAWSQVIGLIVGLYGFFFLSIPIFGDGSIRRLRALLPAAAEGLGTIIGLYPVLVVPVFRPNVPPEVQQTGVALLAIATIGNMVIVFLIALAFSQPTIRRGAWIALFTWVGLQAAWMLIVDGSYVLDLLTQQAGADLIPTLVFQNIGVLVTLGGWLMAGILPQTLGKADKENGLLRLGTVLTAIAILTQFIPPVVEIISATFK